MANKLVQLLGLLVLFFVQEVQMYAQFPYVNPAVSGNDFNQFQGTNRVNFTPYGAELTRGDNEIRGFFLNDIAFTIDRGFSIEFDYIMTGKGPETNYGAGDGFALVLFDGSVDDPIMGAKGAGLGYSYAKSNIQAGNRNGLTKGFLAVGIDLYGNFKSRMQDSSEFRNGIRLENRETDHITIRGQGNLLEGYPVLISQGVSTIYNRYKLNLLNGNFENNFVAPDPKGFSFKLRESNVNSEYDIAAEYGHPSYRRVIVSLLPTTVGTERGYYLKVEVIHGRERSCIVNDFYFPKTGLMKYYETQNGMNDILTSKNIKTPNTLKLGFTGATGLAFQKTYVRNISIVLPFSPAVKDVILENACKDDLTTIDVLSNSLGFNTNIYQAGDNQEALGSKEYLDPYSFQFVTFSNDLLEKTAEPYVATTRNGRYEYDPITTQVVFIPKKGMTATRDQVYFNIKNKETIGENTNLGGEQFRSNNAMIKLNFTHNCNDIIMVNGHSL
ncbi:hypothetical protein [Myroides odoratus]|uniref:hypothetical protein n=1 Tax=Myroides odoratus TaxID=256 RepID=UPI0039B055EB